MRVLPAGGRRRAGEFDGDGKPFQPQVHYFVGGATKLYGPRSEPYPWPAVSHEPRLQEISDDLAKGGYHPFHAPCGILLNEARRPESTCIRCARRLGP